MVISGIIKDNNLKPSCLAMTKQLTQKQLKGFCIERIASTCNQSTITWSNCPKNRYALSGGGEQNYWIALLWRYPHRTTGTVLLKMALIFKPQIILAVLGPVLKFFYMSSGLPGLPWQLQAVACDAEIPTAETAFGIGEHPI